MESALAIFRAEIERQGITQDALGRRIQRSQSWVSHHLEGGYVLSLDDFLRFCTGLNLNPAGTLRKALTNK